MSVSLIALRFEIAEEYNLLPHLHFSVSRPKRPMALADSSSKKVEKKSDVNSPFEDSTPKPSIEKYRGSRELQEITIETMENQGIQPNKKKKDKSSAKESNNSTPSSALSLGGKQVPSHLKEQENSPKKADAKGNSLSKGKNGQKKVDSPAKQVSKCKNESVTAPEVKQLESKQKPDENAPEKPSQNAEKLNSSINKDNVENTERRNKVLHQTQIPFSSGNHFVDVTKGLLHLYKENQRTPLAEEAERSEMLCMLAVPSVFTTHDLLRFTAPVSDDIEHLRIIRESKPNQYMVLMKFRNQLSADEFYKNFNGTKFNTIEDEVCHLAFVAKVETVKESEAACLPLHGHTELPTCPVCLERMDESVEGILTILCNHSFHGSCLAKWGDTSCPVCRYCQTPEAEPDNRCFGCGSQDSLWICLICGHIGCGRYVEGHAYNHYVDTQHTYAMQLGNNRVWDYAGDNYVHRLVQNKTDGKLVELEPQWAENEEKMDSMQLEYTYLLTSQLERQRRYFEDMFSRFETQAFTQFEEMKEKTKHAVDERKQLEEKLSRMTKEKQALDKKLTQVTSKLNKIMSELKDEKEMNKCLRQNQHLWQQRLVASEKSLKELKDAKEKEIQDLQEQVHDLMFYLDAKTKLQNVPEALSQEIQEGQIVISEASGNTSEPAATSSKQRRKKNR